LRNHQRDGHQHCRHQVQVLCLEADGIDIEGRCDEEAVDHGAKHHGQRGPDDLARGQDGLAHDHGRQADDDGADAHGDVGAALRLHEQRAGQADQAVGNGHAQQNHGAGVDALARAMRALEPVERMARPRSVAKNQSRASLATMTKPSMIRAHHIVFNVRRLQHGEQCGVVDQRHVGAAHDAQVDRVQADHHQDGGQQVHDLELDVEPACDEAGHGAGRRAGQRGQPGLVPVEIRMAQTAPPREAAVDRQIGKAQQAKRDEDAQRHQAEDQANFNGTEDGK
jgi:hypothetical protein